MKRTLLSMLVLLSALALRAQFNADKTPLQTKSLSAENIKSVLSKTSGGNILVQGVAASEARVEVYVVPNNYRDNKLSETEIRQRLESEYTITLETTNNKLSATARAKDNKMDWKKALNISFKIYVPSGASTDLTTSGGNIDLNNLSGEQKFTTSGGNLDIDNVSGNMDGTTSGGNIYLKNSHTGDGDLTTSGGNIEAKHCEGKLRLTTSGGSLNLSDLKGTIKATTSGGDVDGKNVDGELFASTSGGSIQLHDLSCSVETSTSGGNITVSMTKLGKYIKIGNSAGNINLTLPKTEGLDLDLTAEKIKTDNMEAFSGKMNFKGKATEDEIVGKLNGGGIPVTVRAGSGTITIGLK